MKIPGKAEPHSLTEWPLQRGSSESCSTSLTPMKQQQQQQQHGLNGGQHSVVSSASASQVFTKWLAKKSEKDAGSHDQQQHHHHHHDVPPPGSPSGSHVISRGQLFPARLALALGMAKTLLGVLLVAFGALALWEHASMAYLGSGLWCGAVVLVCGLLGIMAGQRRTNFVYIVSYLLVSVLSLAAIGLLLIFTATGLARDTGAPLGFFIDLEEGERVDFLGTVPLRQRAVIINAMLIALGTLSTFLSLAASVICLREACLCYGATASSSLYHRRLVNSNSSCNSSHNNKLMSATYRLDSVPNINLLAADQSPEGQARAYRLMRWLRQSHEQQQQHANNAKPMRPPILFRRLYNPPVPVAVPVTVPAGPAGPAFPSFVTGAPTAYVIPAAVIQPMLHHHNGPPAFYSLASMPASMHSTAGLVASSRGGVGVGHPMQHRPPTSLTHHMPKGVKSGRKNNNGNKRTTTTATATTTSADEEADHQVKTPRRRHQSCGTDAEPMPPVPPIPAKVDAASNTQPLVRQQQAATASSDVDSVVSGYVFTGMDREIPEELILHSMTIRHPASVHSTC